MPSILDKGRLFSWWTQGFTKRQLVRMRSSLLVTIVFRCTKHYNSCKLNCIKHKHSYMHQKLLKTRVYKSTKTQIYKDTNLQRHKDTKTQRHKDTKTQRNTYTNLQRHKSTKTQIYKDTNLQRHKSTKTQIYKNTIVIKNAKLIKVFWVLGLMK